MKCRSKWSASAACLSILLTGLGAHLTAAQAAAQPAIMEAGATIVTEGCSPANSAVDPDETVTVSLCLRNVGTADTTSLAATLQAAGGVLSPSGPQNYGVVEAGGSIVCRNFTFIGDGLCGATITPRLALDDAGNDLGTISYMLTLGDSGTCCGPFANEGSTLVTEACEPANGVVDPGEPVTVSLCLRNIGSTTTTDLVATLEQSGGIVAPSGPQSYGVLDPGGSIVCRNFDFAADGVCDGTITAILNLVDGTRDLGELKYPFVLGDAGVCCEGVTCLLTCSADLTVGADPMECGTVVDYPTTASGPCGTITCMPPPGSFFELGETEVTCSSMMGDESCELTITVNDTQPPSISCPPDRSIPSGSSVTAIYGGLAASDNCPNVEIVCDPPEGSQIPQGKTTVTCTATDESGLTATCQFVITVSNPAPVVGNAGVIAAILVLLALGGFYLRRVTLEA